MITGTLMFDVEFKASNTEDQDRIVSAINAAVKAINGVDGCELVDSDISDDADK